ncbi:glycosyltransferase family 39 protein [Candidatus Woesebacteria bacterium]|nr:glycosyltransferase family 39 protein [Candidatus Woesebacteria bacterium]
MSTIKKHHVPDLIILGCILLIALAFRSYKLTSPLIEFHSWRQADTAAVARNYARDGINLLLPKYDDVSPLQTGVDNPNGYRMVEFPLYNAVVAVFYRLVPALNITIWGRLISLLESLVIISCVYAIAKREMNRLAAGVASLVFAIMPFFVFYTRAILPETMATMLVMISVYAVYTKQSWQRSLLSLVAFSLAVLVKPTTIFYGLAIAYLLLRTQPLKVKNISLRIGAIALALIPLGLWRWYIQGYPEGIPASAWLITSVSTGGAMYSIFFRPAFFRWIFYERLDILILGSYNLVLFINGLLARTKTLLPLALLASSGAYVFTFQGGNVQHEYYQILILPTVALFVGFGAAQLVKVAHNRTYKIAAYVIIGCAIAAGWFISWDKVHHYYYSLSDIPQFAKIVQTFTKPTDRIVVDTAGDTTALYAFDRKGSPGIYSKVEVMKEKGYGYVFTYNHTTADSLQKDDPTIKRIFENDRFILFKL